METNKSEDKSKPIDDLGLQTLYHGTKADLKTGDLIKVGFNSNYGQKKNAKYICGLLRFYHRLVGGDLGLVLKYYRGDGR